MQPNKVRNSIVLKLVIPLAVMLIAFGGCSRKPGSAKKGKGPDLQYGWYHWATGKETVEAISQLYKRNPELVAEVNRTQPKDIPKAKALIYLPPTEERSTLIQILKKVNTDPKLVAKTPPTPAQFLAFEQAQAKAAAAAQPAPAKAKAESKSPPASQPSQASASASGAAASGGAPLAGSSSSTQVAPHSGASTAATQGTAKPTSVESSKTGDVPPPAPPPKAVASTEPATPTSASNASPPPANRADKPAVASLAPSQHGIFTWPVRGKVLKEFNADPASPYRGILIAAPAGSAVVAARDGKIVFAGDLSTYGKVIIIEHDSGLLTVYGFNESLKVKNYQEVRAGQQIAVAGRPPGMSENQILFEIRKNARAIDPLMVLPPS